MKKILFLTHVGDPGGAEFEMIRHCTALAPRAEVMHFLPGTLSAHLKEHGIPERMLDMPESLAGIKRKDGILKILKTIPAALSFMTSLIKETRRYDILVCMSQKSFILVALAKIFIRRPLIWFMNDLVSEEHFNKHLIKLMTTLARLSANHIVLNSQASHDAWIKAGGQTKNISVIYPSVEIERFENTAKDPQAISALRQKFTPDNRPLIGMFGRITVWKGQDVFLRALAKTKDTRAIIVGEAYFGEQEYEQNLHTLIKELHLEDRVTMTGHLDNIPAVMSACDIIVHCSTAPEPFGLVIVEAMAAQKPVIASNAGGAQEIVQNNITGQLTPPGDDTALAAAIKTYLDDPAWAEKLAKAGKNRVKDHFSTHICNEKLKNIIANVEKHG